MKRSLLPLLLVAALGLGAYLAVQETVPWWLKDISGPTMPHWLRDLLGRPAAPVNPFPLTPPRRPLPAPAPCPGPGPCPRRPSWGAQAEIAIGDRISVQGQPTTARFVIGGPSLDGVEAACDLPAVRHQRNTGGSDGAGLCVFTSIGMVADWHGNQLLTNFRDWMKTRPGGGYPDKVRQMIEQLAREKGENPPPYLQVTNGDETILEEAMKNRLMLGITYGGRDGVYYRGPVPHMVCLVAFDRKADRAAILDNNYPGQLLWMGCKDLTERWKDGGGGWAFAMLQPGPPPVPVNQVQINEGQPMFASCPNCPPAPPAIVSTAVPNQSPANVPVWWPHPQDPRTWYLSRDGKQVGTYTRNDDTYHALQADNTFKDDVLPPVPVPEVAWPAQPIRHNNRVFGVETNKVRQAPAYEISGRAVQRAELIGAIQAAGLPEVRGKVWCVVAGGTPQQRQQVIDDIDRNPDLAAIRNRFVVKQYAAGDWPLDVGLQSKGAPSIQFLGAEDDRGQAPDLGHFNANPGAAELGQAMIGALRQVDPNYRPELVRRPNSPYGDEAMLLTIAAIVVVAFLLLLPGRRR